MNRVYIYNEKQAYYYIQSGLIPLKVDKHHKTGNIFYVFDKEKSNKFYTVWLNKEAELKVI